MISEESRKHFYEVVRLCEILQILPYRSVQSELFGFSLEFTNGWFYRTWFLIDIGFLIASLLFSLWKLSSPDLGMMSQVLSVIIVVTTGFALGSQVLFFVGQEAIILCVNLLISIQYRFGQEI